MPEKKTRKSAEVVSHTSLGADSSAIASSGIDSGLPAESPFAGAEGLRSYPVELLDYELPEELIPQQPLEKRDASRLLVVSRKDGSIFHRKFIELPEILDKNDFIVFNDSKVMRTRFHCVRKQTGGKVELLLTRILDGSKAECLTKARGHIRAGEELVFINGYSFIVESPTSDQSPGIVSILVNGKPANEGEINELMEMGELPLPPYLKQKLNDEQRYQTVFARRLGSSAAPTAALHFSQEILDRLTHRGVGVAFTTLHVGTATFLPIRSSDAVAHTLRPEYYFISPSEFRRILSAKLAGKRIVAVGTTVTRLLESVFSGYEVKLKRHNISIENLATISDEKVREAFRLAGETNLYILPGYKFCFVDRLLTNFHLPRTTLLALVYAFGGRGLIRRAYAEAIRLRYRFYSLGDAMLIL